MRGVIKQGEIFYEFSTLIDRESSNLEQISENFSKSFEQLNDATRIKNAQQEYWTEYEYVIRGDGAKEAVRVGISEIDRCLPCLFTFNNLNTVKINERKYIRSVEQTMNNGTFVQRVGSTNIWVTKSEMVDVGLAIDSETDKVIDLSDAPRVYVRGLPLVDTGDYIRIPFTLNSAKLDTTEDRDSLTNIEMNDKILQEAFSLYYKLVEEISQYHEKQIEELYRLVAFQMVSDERLHQNPLLGRLNEIIRETIVKIVDDVPLVEIRGGTPQQISNVLFPAKTLKSTELLPGTFDRFYELLIKIRNNVPTRTELDSWIHLASKLKDEFGDVVNIRLYSIDNMKDELVEFVKKSEDFPQFGEFNTRYDLSDSKIFLQSFFKLIDELYNCKIIESPQYVDYLLPDQEDIIGPLKWDADNLCIDERIPEELKDIIHRIGWNIRQSLVNRDFADFTIVRDLLRDNLDVRKAIEKTIKDYQLEREVKEDLEHDNKVQGWIDLFHWCVINGQVCKGLQIITKDGRVQQIDDLDNEAFIIPFNHMGIGKEFEEIYPASRIIHPKYFKAENSQEFIKHLEHRVFVRSLPVYESRITLGYNKLESVLFQEHNVAKVDHKIECSTGTISTLPFWNEIIGRVSDYQERARLLFRFVIEYLINRDTNWQHYIQVNCSCIDKSHEIIPSQWLASLKTDAWLPCKITENDQERLVRREATKEGIEELFHQHEIDQILMNNPENVTKLLLQFGFDELNLKVKLQSIQTGKPEEVIRKEVSTLVDINNIVPGLADIAGRDIDAFKETIQKFKEMLDKKPLKDENKVIGENVERIIRKFIRDQGFTVIPIYKGGDLEIWEEDNEGWDSGVIEVEPYLVEVKFTSTSRVHLSKAQSLTAREREGNYIVLVVENTGNLRERLKGEIDENAIPEDVMNDLMDNSHILERIYSRLGSIPNPEEVEPDINGYWVKRKLWSDKNSLCTWIEQVLNN